MAAEAEAGSELVKVVALLASGVIAVPIFRHLGLGSVLGYLAAGLAIGPFGLGLFSDPQAILHVAELGVVMFLFVIGLEMQPTRLWGLRREIFGLGTAQVVLVGSLLIGTALLAGLAPAVAFVAAMGFTLSSTAIVMQLLDERGETSTPLGQRVVSILLFEDLAIVPLLAFIAFLSPGAASTSGERWVSIGIGIASIAGLVLVGRWLLNPMFRLLANSKAREVMTAAALLVVLGAALLMQFGGLSMAMGAFLAGVLLSESTFRHQLEADIEPFRGILLGLFFLSVGMSLDLAVFIKYWPQVVAGVLAFMSLKCLGVYVVARVIGTAHAEALQRAALLGEGGEFAFVLYAAAAASGIFDTATHAILAAIVILSMALTPLRVFSLRWLLPRAVPSMEGVDKAEDLNGKVLMIGFGRFGQVASQALLARGIEVSIIDTGTDMIRSAADFGFKVYYGDGTRLDVLRASGAQQAQAIAVCIRDEAASLRIVELVKHEFPHARLLVRAYDRQHALKLIGADVDYQIREVFESASAFGVEALRLLGVPEQEAVDIGDDVRRRDAERLQLQVTGGLQAGRDLMHGNRIKPQPLTAPKKSGQPLSPETAALTHGADKP